MFFEPNIEQYLSYFSFSNIKFNDIVEIIIFIMLTFYVINHFQNTRIWILIKGIITLFLIYILSNIFSLKIITTIFQNVVSFLIIALIMMFQPELRKMLESVGTKNFSSNLRSIFKKSDNKRFTDNTIQEIALAADNMSKAKTGALILIENNIPLDEYIKTGIPINSDITSQLITNIFEKNTPLHDGAMIIRNNKIIAATCYLPLSENKSINKSLGTRHRAAIGASEQTDSFIIVVSEETGAISYVQNGKIKHKITVSELIDKLQQINYIVKPTVANKKGKSFFKTSVLSIIFGAFFWGVFTFMYNPIETIKINDIPVETVNENVVTNLNKVYEITSNDTIDIEVTGEKDVINSLKPEDFSAKADFTQLSITNAIPIQVTTNKNVSINTNNAIMTISIEDASEIDLNVELQKQGTEMEGFFVYNLSTSTPTIKVSGPKSIIQTIDKAVAKVNVNNAHKNFTTNSDIVIYDKNGNIIDNTEYTTNIDNIEINTFVYDTKEVEVKLKVSDDSTKTKIKIINQKLSKEKILVAANKDMLDSLDHIDVTIDTTDSMSNTINSIIDIRNFLPSGVQCAEDPELEYTVEIGKFITQTLSLNKDEIEIVNGDGKISANKINVNLLVSEKSENISAKDLEPYIDVNNLEPGRYNLPLQFKNSNNIKIEDVCNINVIVTK